MKWTLHPAAESDLASILDFYRAAVGTGLAQRFLSEFERVMNLLTLNPGFGTPNGTGRRTYPMRIFPYSVVNRPMGEEIRVLVVRHQHRHPRFGDRRR